MARKYRCVPTSSWDEPQYLRLPPPKPCARYLLRFLETGPHTNSVPGLFRAGIASVAEQLGWSVKEARPLFDLLTKEGWLRMDRVACLVFLPRSFDHEPPANAKAVLGWRTIIKEMPDCALKREACAELLQRLKTLDASREKPKDGKLLAGAGAFLVPDTVAKTVPDTVSRTAPETVPHTVSPPYAIPLSTDALSTDALSTEGASAKSAPPESPPSSNGSSNGISREMLLRMLPALGIRDELDSRAQQLVAQLQPFDAAQVREGCEAFLGRPERPSNPRVAYIVAMVSGGAKPKTATKGAAVIRITEEAKEEHKIPGRKML